MASGAHGTAGVEEEAKKKFIEFVTGQLMLSELFSGPRRRTGRVLAATHQRDRPVRGLVQVSKTRRAKREVDPCV
jgi:hypothetical protein